MTLTRRVSASSRRIAKSLAFDVARHTARYLPVRYGPAWWRRLAGRVRVAVAIRVVRRDGVAAERIVRALLDTPDSGRGWYLMALARERRRDQAGALEAAREATRVAPTGYLTIEALLLHRAQAVRAGHRAEALEVLQRLVVVPPASPAHITATIEALADADHALRERYVETLHSQKDRIGPDRRREAEAELRLLEARTSDPQALAAELRRIVDELPRPVHLVTRAFSACQAWDPLAAFLDDHLGPGAGISRHVPRRQLRQAAIQAFDAGHTDAAVRIARHVLAMSPDDLKLRTKADEGASQVRVAADGWPEPPRSSPTPYEPRGGAVLSVLAQSVPFTSGGYASRSHGILTGLAAGGLDMRAVTRLGFPLTWWRGTGGRQVTALDVVDGIPYHRLLVDGVRDYPQHPLHSFIEQYAQGLVEHAVEHRAQLIHASSFYINGLAGAAAARQLGIPFVYEMRGLEELMQVSRHPAFEGSDRHRFLATVELAACRDADAVFVITEALGRELIDRGISQDRIVVLPNGVHADRFAPRARDAGLARQLGVENKTVIGYAGGLVDYEGLDLLLLAAAALKERRRDFHVLIVGDGHHEPALRSMVDRMRLGDVTTFTGRVAHSDIDRYLSLFDITPFPRLPLPVCELISPIKPFEAMATGKAVVASDVAALAEIVQDGRTGLLVEKGSAEALTEALERLLDSADLRASLGRAARAWVTAERDWSTIVPRVEETYRRLLDSPRRGHAPMGAVDAR
jgi:glycosyltransferase involved in cell wall biosynthesis